MDVPLRDGDRDPDRHRWRRRRRGERADAPCRGPRPAGGRRGRVRDPAGSAALDALSGAQSLATPLARSEVPPPRLLERADSLPRGRAHGQNAPFRPAGRKRRQVARQSRGIPQRLAPVGGSRRSAARAGRGPCSSAGARVLASAWRRRSNAPANNRCERAVRCARPPPVALGGDGGQGAARLRSSTRAGTHGDDCPMSGSVRRCRRLCRICPRCSRRRLCAPTPRRHRASPRGARALACVPRARRGGGRPAEVRSARVRRISTLRTARTWPDSFSLRRVRRRPRRRVLL